MEQQQEKLPHRGNGWTWPPSYRQMATISIFLVDAVVFLVFLMPLMSGAARWLSLIFFGLTALFAFSAGARVMTINPVDPLTVGKACDWAEEDLLFCRYCNSNVRGDSKHCWECGKCVANYDHHCAWLNTCIGTRNYGSFFVAIWSTLLMCAVVLASGILTLSRHAMDNGVILDGDQCLLLIAILLNSPVFLLVGTLVAFHTFLCYEDITTYEYLTGKVSMRKKQKMLEMSKEAATMDATDNHELSAEADLPSNIKTANAPEGVLREKSTRSIRTEGSVAASVFRSIVATEGDLAIKRSVSSFVFGSEVAGVVDPEQSSTTATIGMAVSSPKSGASERC